MACIFRPKKTVVSCFNSLMQWWLEKGFDCSQGTGCPSVEIRLNGNLYNSLSDFPHKEGLSLRVLMSDWINNQF